MSTPRMTTAYAAGLAVAFLTCGCATIGLSEPTVQRNDLPASRRTVPADRAAITIQQTGVTVTVSVTSLCDQMVQRDVKVTKTYELRNKTPGVDYLAAAAAGALLVAGVVVLADANSVAPMDRSSQEYNPIGPGGAKAIGGSLIAAGGVTFIIPIADAARASGTREEQLIENPPETVEKTGVPCGPFPGVRVNLKHNEDVHPSATTTNDGVVQLNLAERLQGEDLIPEVTTVTFVITTPKGHAQTFPASIDFSPIYAAHENAAWEAAHPSCRNAMFLRDCDLLKAYASKYGRGRHAAEAQRLLEEHIPKLTAIEAEQAYQKLDIPDCVTGSKEQTSDDVVDACNPLLTYLRDYPAGAHLDEVTAALDKGKARARKLRDAEEVEAARQQRAEEARAEREAKKAEQEAAREAAAARFREEQEARQRYQQWRNDCISECNMACSARYNPLMCVNSCINLRCSQTRFEESGEGW